MCVVYHSIVCQGRWPNFSLLLLILTGLLQRQPQASPATCTLSPHPTRSALHPEVAVHPRLLPSFPSGTPTLVFSGPSLVFFGLSLRRWKEKQPMDEHISPASSTTAQLIGSLLCSSRPCLSSADLTSCCKFWYLTLLTINQWWITNRIKCTTAIFVFLFF